MTHKQFLANIKQLAVMCGWMVYYTVDPRHSPAGFPDLILLRDKCMVVAELKVQHYISSRDTWRLDDLKPEQYEWMLAFREITEDVYLWTETDEDWAEIQEVLR